MSGDPEFEAGGIRQTIKMAMSTVVPRDWLPQIIRPVGVLGTVVLLGIITIAGQVAVTDRGTSLLPTIAFTVENPTKYSRRVGWCAA